MKIAVFIKQVPDTTDVKWTENNNIDRIRMDSIINPVDKQAIEAALFFKDNYNVQITAVSMRPEKAKIILKEALAMGADEAFLLSSPKFTGSDTCATSRVLSAFIREKISDVDLIIFGQSAIDGETSQTGPSTAVRLNMPFITQVNKIKEFKNSQIIVISDTEIKQTEFLVNLPCVLCINNFSIVPRLPKISGYLKAQKYNITSLNHNDLNLNENDIGIKGSPTWVLKVFKSPEGRKCEFINFDKSQNCLNMLENMIKEAVKDETK